MHMPRTMGRTLSTPRGDLLVRRAGRGEVQQILEWADAEGWNPGRNDAECFYRADPKGFLLGLLGGEPVGAISAVVYDDAFAFYGCFIVKPEYRYHGIASPLVKAGQAYVGNRCAGLDGVVAMQRAYRRLGFHIAHRNVRFGGLAEGQIDPQIVPLPRVPWDDVLAYDRRHFPAARSGFLRAWVDQPGAVALGAIRQGHLAGYGVIRPCRTGCKIGPLFADDPATAERLFQSLCAHATGQPVFLDVPEPNRQAVALAERYGMKPVFETARMYSGPAPEILLNEVFGITTYELG